MVPRILIVIVVAVAIALLMWFCRPGNRAAQIASQAATADQSRLWQDVGRRGTPTGLARLPVQAPSVSQPRRSVQPSTQTIPPAPGSLAPGVITGARIVSTSRSGPWQHSGLATVARVDGERIELDLGPNGSLVLVARLNGSPLGVTTNQSIDCFYSTNSRLFERERILALRTGSGAVIISAVKTGNEPVKLTVSLPMTVSQPPFALTAAQTGLPVNGSMAVEVDVGAGAQTLNPATTNQVGGFSIDLLGSIARTGNPKAADASPYAIDLIAWRPAAGRGGPSP